LPDIITDYIATTELRGNGQWGYPEMSVTLSGVWGFEDGHAPEKTRTTSMDGTGFRGNGEDNCWSRGGHVGVFWKLIGTEEE